MRLHHQRAVRPVVALLLTPCLTLPGDSASADRQSRRFGSGDVVGSQGGGISITINTPSHRIPRTVRLACSQT